MYMRQCEVRIGILEGTYYGEEGDYRSQWINIMWCCYLYYVPVNIDGYAIGSIMNQGFRNYSVALVNSKVYHAPTSDGGERLLLRRMFTLNHFYQIKNYFNTALTLI